MKNKNVELNKAYGDLHKKIGGWVTAKGRVRKYRFMSFFRQDFLDAGLKADLFHELFISEGWMDSVGRLRQNPRIIRSVLKHKFDNEVADKVMAVLKKSNLK